MIRGLRSPRCALIHRELESHRHRHPVPPPTPPSVANRPRITTTRYRRCRSSRSSPRWLPTAVVATRVPPSTDSRNTIRPPVVPFNMHELSFLTRHRMNHISAVLPVRHSLFLSFPSPCPSVPYFFFHSSKLTFRFSACLVALRIAAISTRLRPRIIILILIYEYYQN